MSLGVRLRFYFLICDFFVWLSVGLLGLVALCFWVVGAGFLGFHSGGLITFSLAAQAAGWVFTEDVNRRLTRLTDA